MAFDSVGPLFSIPVPPHRSMSNPFNLSRVGPRLRESPLRTLLRADVICQLKETAQAHREANQSEAA
jgi:hypothetical protein